VDTMKCSAPADSTAKQVKWSRICTKRACDRVVQDCENEGPHYGLKKNQRAARRGTPLQLKDSFAVLTDLIFLHA